MMTFVVKQLLWLAVSHVAMAEDRQRLAPMLRATASITMPAKDNVHAMVGHSAALLPPSEEHLYHEEATAIVEQLPRQLQTRLYDISPAVISFQGMQLTMEHTVRDQVQTEQVRIDVFRDDACTFLIDNPTNDYLTIDLVNDLTATGDGSGTRQMSVVYTINPQTVVDSRIINFSSEDPIISFCTRFNLLDPATGEVANSLDTIVAVRVDITDQLQILALLEDEEDSYVAEAFECDDDNNRLTDPPLKTQGARVRVCFQPDAFTQDFGVVMRSINQFTMVRGDVTQEVIVPDGVIKDLDQTIYRCTPGDKVCYVETEVANRFFYSRGTVSATGVAWLQYASDNERRRGLIQVPFSINVGARDEVAPAMVFASPLGNRRTVEAGGFIGSRDIAMSFEVEPSGTNWEARAFLCNGQNRPLVGTALTRPRNKDDDIRVCFMPSNEAREKGVYVREVSTFFFEQPAEERVQFAIEPSKKTASRSIVICNAGEPLCALKTELSLDFFNKNLNVVGRGEVLLQYGTVLELPSRRGLQDDPTVDAGFAGRADVSIEFRTDPTYVAPDEKTWQEKAEEWWLGTPLFLRIVYVLAVVIGFLILLCFLWAICCGNPFRSKKEQPEGPVRKRHIFLQPVFVRNKNKWEADNDKDDSETQTRNTSEPQDPIVSASHRLENGPMDPVPEAETAHFDSSPKKATKEPLPMIEPDYSRSPKSSGAMSGLSGIKSPRRAGSKRSTEAGSVNSGLDDVTSPKRSNSKHSTSSSKSPRVGQKAALDGDSMKSPRSPRRKNSLNDSVSSNVSMKSSLSKSPKPRRSKRTDQPPTPGSASGMKSPLPRRGEAGASPRGSTRKVNGSKSPVSGKSPKRRAMDDSGPSPVSTSSRRTPRGSRKSSTESTKKNNLPDAPIL